MKLQMLPSTFDENGRASRRQHLSCLIVDGSVSIDAGSLAIAAGESHREKVRDIVLSHAHLDHIAGLPLFVDDLFAVLKEPVRVHATREVIEVLERDVFNWSVYPRFSELQNDFGRVMEYVPFEPGREFAVGHLRLTPVGVNHKVPAVGFHVSDGRSGFVTTGDTAKLDGFWDWVNGLDKLDAVLIECAFPNELSGLAGISHHLTPDGLAAELAKLEASCRVFVINIKPMYFEAVEREIAGLGIANVEILEVGAEIEI